MAAERLGVIIAVREEAEAILSDTSWGWAEREPGLWASAHAPIRLCLSGIGKVFASWAAARIAPSSDLILSLGTSGGLSDEDVGSIWISSTFVERDMDASALWFEPGITPYSGMKSPLIKSAGAELVERAWKAAAQAGLAIAGEAISASGDSFVADPVAARALRNRTGARLCDMESAAIAKLAVYRAGIPFLALRAVSDNADHAARRSWEEEVKLSSTRFGAFLHSFYGL